MGSSVQERIAQAVDSWSAHPMQLEAIRKVLQREGHALHAGTPCRFGGLVLLVHEAAGGVDRETALDGAAAMELFMAAGYTLDHVMDEEVPEGQHLGAEACLATTLTFLAHAVLDQATATALPSAQRVSFMAEVHQMLLKSVAGQHRDLTFAAMPPNVEVTTDDALETTELKAGALGRLAGVIGARLASANPDIAERIGECCWYYATYRQLIDDLSCAPTDDDGRAGDASANKRTLPLVYWSDWQRRVGDSPTASLPPAL